MKLVPILMMCFTLIACNNNVEDKIKIVQSKTNQLDVEKKLLSLKDNVENLKLKKKQDKSKKTKETFNELILRLNEKVNDCVSSIKKSYSKKEIKELRLSVKQANEMYEYIVYNYDV